MGGLLVLGAIVAAWIAFDKLAIAKGVDSRPMSRDGRKPTGILSV
jgi:hypothetical protein